MKLRAFLAATTLYLGLSTLYVSAAPTYSIKHAVAVPTVSLLHGCEVDFAVLEEHPKSSATLPVFVAPCGDNGSMDTSDPSKEGVWYNHAPANFEDVFGKLSAPLRGWGDECPIVSDVFNLSTNDEYPVLLIRFCGDGTYRVDHRLRGDKPPYKYHEDKAVFEPQSLASSVLSP